MSDPVSVNLSLPKALSVLVICCVWAFSPIVRRRMVERAQAADDVEGKNNAVQVVLCVLGCSYALLVVLQLCMRLGPGTYSTLRTNVERLRVDGVGLLVLSSGLTLISNFVLTDLLLRYNPGHIMPMLNASSNFFTYVVGTVVFGLSLIHI